jgi:membrane associated rhomboid family serine protease
MTTPNNDTSGGGTAADDSLMSPRTALVLLIGVLAAILLGGLTYLNEPNTPLALIAAISAFVGGVLFGKTTIR